MTDNIEDIDTLTADAPPEYDPDFDNCAGGCVRNDNRRVAFSWFHMLHFACPGCYEALFAASPEDAGERIIVLPDPNLVPSRGAADGGAADAE